MLPPEIREMPEIRLAGVAFEPEKVGWDKVPVLLYRLAGTVGRVVGAVEPGVVYGFIEPNPERPGPGRYVAAVEVADLEAQPEGIATTTVPGGLYAVFTVEGGLGAIGPAYEHINQTWMPTSGYREARCGAVEVYGEAFQPDAACRFEIRVAVERV